MEITLIKAIILALTGFFAGFVDSIAGGGGIITVPVLLSLGLPPHMALGTNKLQACFGSVTSTWRYYKKGLFSFKENWPAIVTTVLGAIIGTLLIQRVDGDFLSKAIPLLLLVVFLYTLFKKDMGVKDRAAKIPRLLFLLPAGLILGFYDGFFGPGTGSFWTIGLVGLYGLNLTKATGTTKLMNFTSNVVSLIVFIIGGKIIVIIGVIMGMGQIVGAWTGSHMVVRHGTKFIRIFFLSVVAITIGKMIFENFAS